MNYSDIITVTVSSLVTALQNLKLVSNLPSEVLGCGSFVRKICGRVIPGYCGLKFPHFDIHWSTLYYVLHTLNTTVVNIREILLVYTICFLISHSFPRYCPNRATNYWCNFRFCVVFAWILSIFLLRNMFSA
jgi:hypothetical protein